MRKIAESGMQNREVRRIYTRKPVCQSRASNFGSVGLIDCYFPFVIFGGGVLLSIALFLIELSVKKYYINLKKKLYKVDNRNFAPEVFK